MSSARLAIRQVAFENRAFWRNPAAAFFTFVFPLMFMVIFNLIFGNSEYEGFGGRAVPQSTFYTPAIIAFSIITACYTNLAIGTSFAREYGDLKRVRGTPLPAWAYLFGRIVHAVFVALVLVVIVAAFGRAFYHIAIPGHTMPAFVVSLVVGAFTFSALGLALTAAVPNVDAAPAVVNASVLPLLFISDVFIPLSVAPDWVGRLAGAFPIKRLSHAVITPYNPFERGAGFEVLDLAILAAWGVAGVLLAIRFFSWEPRGA